jgi:hypothetical protein
MATPRAYHGATLLADGRVLVTGGYLFDSDIDDDPELLVTAELWEPETGTFSATGEMTAPHSSHDAVLLEDGRVLVPPERVELGVCYAEGCHGATVAEFWEPLEGRFSPLELDLHGHNGGSATRLADGRVLIVGGEDVEMLGGDGGFVGNAVIYDPETGMFEPTGALAEKRIGHTATLTADGRVLIVGGSNERSELLDSGELFDPALGSFIPAGSMSRARSGHTATLLSDGRVLITGGSGRRGPMAGVELWVPGGEADSKDHSP